MADNTITSKFISCKFNTTTFVSGTSAYTTGCDTISEAKKTTPPNANSDKSGSCPAFKDTCDSNLTSDINTVFDNISENDIITDSSIKAIYTEITSIASNRSLTDIAIPSNIATGKIVDKDDYDTLVNWVNDLTTSASDAESKRTGDLIDSSMSALKNKMKAIAHLCKSVDHNSCASVCQCNTVCSCNCHSDY